MKFMQVAIAALLMAVTISPTFGEEPGDRKAKAKRAGQAGAGQRGARFRELKKKFDKDGDGKLSDAEKAELRKHIQANGGGNGGRPNRAELIKKFDKDGDGKLNEQERKAAMASRGKRPGNGGDRPNRAEILKKFDKDGDGKLNEQERQAAMAAGRAAMEKRFDKDGDGKLNEEERAAMRKAMEERRKNGGAAGRPTDSAAAPARKNRLSDEVLKKFDKDGDGELNAEERKAARASKRPKDAE